MIGLPAACCLYFDQPVPFRIQLPREPGSKYKSSAKEKASPHERLGFNIVASITLDKGTSDGVSCQGRQANDGEIHASTRAPL